MTYVKRSFSARYAGAELWRDIKDATKFKNVRTMPLVEACTPMNTRLYTHHLTCCCAPSARVCTKWQRCKVGGVVTHTNVHADGQTKRSQAAVGLCTGVGGQPRLSGCISGVL